MKKAIKGMFVIIGIMTANYQLKAQCDVASHNFSAGYYVGWNSSNALDFKLGSTPTTYLQLTTAGDLDIVSSANAYKLGGNKFLWHKSGQTSTLFIGVGAGNTSAAIQSTFVGASAGANTASDQGSNVFVGYKAGYGNAGSGGTGGGQNTFIGVKTAEATSYGNDNTFVGYVAGQNNTTSSNTFIGASSGVENTSGSYNAYLGYGTGLFNQTGEHNTLVGHGAGNGVAIGYSFNKNTFIGASAGEDNTTSNENVAVGYRSLYSQTWANSGTGYGTYNVALGCSTLYLNNPTATSNAINNTAMGHAAGYSNSTGKDNIFMGYKSGYGNTSGGSNVLSGYEAGYSNTTSSNNSMYGYQAGYYTGNNAANNSNSFFGYKAGYGSESTLNSFFGYLSGTAVGDGEKNSFFGSYSGTANTSGDFNSFFGHDAGAANTKGNNNVFMGYQSAYGNTTASDNVAIGYQALYTQSYSNTNTLWSSYNVALGYKALFANAPSSTVTGRLNTAVGYGAGLDNTTGQGNVFYGLYSGQNNTTADYNTFLGYQTGNDNTTGTGNVHVGFDAGMYNVTGSNNTTCGYQAGFGVSTNSNSYNSFFGYKAGFAITTGAGNVSVGYQAGNTITTGTYNTCLGYDADVSSASQTNSTALGNGAIADASNTIVLGNSSVSYLRCNTQTILALTSDRRVKNNIKENVPGLAFINLLKPVTYNANIHKANEIRGYKTKKDSLDNVVGIDTTFWEGKYDGEKISCTGLIAQQVDSAAQQIRYDFQGIYRPKHEKDIYGLDYTKFVMPLIKSVQELSHKHDSLVAVITEMKGGNNRGIVPNNNGQPSGKSETISQIDLANNSETILYQNEPNPFDGSTVIRYFVPENVTAAYVGFYDMYGKEIKKLEIKEKGFGKIEAHTENLANGIYSYSIMVDGKVADTKKMLKSK